MVQWVINIKYDFRNFITGLSINPTATAASIYGIKAGASCAATFANNIISLGGTAAAPLYGIFYGIYEGAGSGYTANLYFNTVYIGGTPTSGTLINSYALYSTSLHTRDFRNNIFTNARANGGTATGKHYAAYFLPNTTATGLTEDYNDYYAPGAGGIFGRFNLADVVSLTAWKIATGQDANSSSTNPVFSNSSGIAATDYFISAALPATIGTGITTDFSGSPRSLTTPRTGAWEVNHLLPVRFLYFTGYASENENYLQWITAGEMNNNLFELQISATGTNFSTIASINSKGNSLTDQYYNFRDLHPFSGPNFYRLKLVDKDGRFDYSSTISISKYKSIKQLAVYPNPVTNGGLNLQLPFAAVLSIYNSMGVQVLSRSLEAGRQQLDVSYLARGIYFISANNEKLKIIIR